MDQNSSPKNQVVERLNKANNVLISVSRDPSVDQLSGAIGLALVLNKLGKHAVAVFSGAIPSTLEFLQPEKTFEKTTDSLRDFIISLDKSKADKLRYKVENNLVRVFITPYRTSLSQDDLEFSQGDFNVDVVMALGVHEQAEIDQAITAHGRILHDATVIAVNKDNPGSLGSLNWSDPNTSSLCEMLTSLSGSLKEGVLDNQMATAFLTGIVAETNRFSNDKTKPSTMQASSTLMTAGANQQLVATKLQEGSSNAAGNNGELPEVDKSSDGSLEIAHGGSGEEPINQINTDEHGQIGTPPSTEPNEPARLDDVPPPMPVDNTVPPPPSAGKRSLAMQPPTFASKLTANTETEHLDPSVDIVGAGAVKPPDQPMLSRRKLDGDQPEQSADEPKQEDEIITAEQAGSEPPSEEAPPPEPPRSLADLEAQVNSPHLQQTEQPAVEPPLSAENHLAQARDAVSQATGNTVLIPNPDAQSIEPAAAPDEQSAEQPEGHQSVESDPGLPPGLNLQGGNTPTVTDPTAPPPVPPPMMPPQDGQDTNNPK